MKLLAKKRKDFFRPGHLLSLGKEITGLFFVFRFFCHTDYVNCTDQKFSD